jgi:hypothetical protein
MYFESRSHTSQPVASPTEAVRLIKSGECSINICPTFTNSKGQRVCLVDDGHIDTAWREVAVINLDTNRRLESITFDWCDEAEALGAVQGCIDAKGYSDITFPIDGKNEDQLVNFLCSCCGDWFPSTVSEQKKHDFDAGYGLCPDCE